MRGQFSSIFQKGVSPRNLSIAGVAEGVRDWSDHLRKTSTTKLLVRPKVCKYKTLTVSGKIFGPTMVGVVGPLPPALYSYVLVACLWSNHYDQFLWLVLNSNTNKKNRKIACQWGLPQEVIETTTFSN